MPERSVVHSTFTIERRYGRPPARVFAAWADPSLKSRWFGGGTDEAPIALDTDFRVGGHERDRVEPGTDAEPAYDARFHDIVPDERIVFTYDLTLDGSLVSVSLATVEFRQADVGAGTQLTYTEHGAFFDGLDDPELRKNGTGGMLTRWAAGSSVRPPPRDDKPRRGPSNQVPDPLGGGPLLQRPGSGLSDRDVAQPV